MLYRFGMLRVTRFVSAAVGAVIVAAVAAPSADAQEFFAAQREFKLSKACDATRSISTKSDPTALAAGTTVVARGLNRRNNPTHAFVVIDRANKWVELGCGEFTDGHAVDDSGETERRPAKCLAFFDDVDNPVDVKVGGKADITPKAPVLNAFDKALANVCGAPGKIVAIDEFKALMQANPDVLDRIKSFTGGKVFADRPAKTSRADYLEQLAEAWFAHKAFDHVFCGEPNGDASRGRIGGLHFVGRYMQLQEAGQACRMDNLRQNEVVPGVIYTMGVLMQNASGRIVRDARKGYALTMSGEDILKAATKAFLDNPTDSSETVVCLAAVTDNGKQFTEVFGRRKTGIRTLYPDATPSKTDAACKSPIKL